MKMNSYKIQILQNPISKKFYGEVWVDDVREYRTCKPMVSEIIAIKATNKAIDIINMTKELKGIKKQPMLQEKQGVTAIEWKNPRLSAVIKSERGKTIHKVQHCQFDEEGNLSIKLDRQTRHHSVLTFDLASIEKLKTLLLKGKKK
ncbi:hypothetical protein E2R48_09450 [Histophilus somni]|uniref:Uncharacterized protein n=2 Tax=Histophilus somni TaxID=731 RepID=A0AAX2S0N3_HISSO|nr:hypothetical protein [Histophilus somni]ARU64349.1 hypothetical protein BTV18_01915 [Histophilus somni]ARU74677.1 hypothetical protein BTV22_07695 [Histophilus somni]QEH14868.1 hypothetical protein FWK46_07750 [Histophilus somni]QEH20273.1 hypothetical protein FWK49_07760 [Histophilus somni]QEH23860.1 hypothetical protein FWK58_07775 [Histophilus somni]